MKTTSAVMGAALAAILAFTAIEGQAADKVRVAASQKGFWDTTIILWGDEKGFFKEQGIDLDIVYTDGGSDAQQAVISGSMDIALSTGTLGVLSAFAKGAPLVVISASCTGSPDIGYFVKGASPIKSAKDLEGKSVAFSRPGSSTNLIAQKIVDASGVKAKLVSTGGAPATLTAVMSGQVDVGWMVPPMNVELLQKGEIRIVFNGNDAPGIKDQTVRVNAANRQWVEKNPDLARRFLVGMKKTIDWAYAGDEALQKWADMHKITLAQAKEAQKSGYPKTMMQLGQIGALDLTMQEAVDTKRLEKPLSDAQKAEFLKWVQQLNKG